MLSVSDIDLSISRTATRALLLLILFVVTAYSVLIQHRSRNLQLSSFTLAKRLSIDHDVVPELQITQFQRSRHIIDRLSRFTGNGRGFSRVSHVFVSLMGILGMFSAIVGALVGPWLADTTDESTDDDRFCYWDDEEYGVRCGLAREDKYILQRLMDSP